ncbi:MAG: DUF3332 family protein [Leptospiraceae bacterium]|nr:DUF3332 family protein [Leptospiraceae bacterium]
MKPIWNKIVLSILILTISYTPLLNCFGKFSLTRKLYQVVDGLKIGDGKILKAIQTVILYICIYFFIVPITFAIDFIILNLLEFWMGKNLLGLNEYNKDGMYVKKFQNGNQSVVLRYSGFGSRLDLMIFDGKKVEEFVLLKKEPGKIFKEEKNELKEIAFSKNIVGSKLLIQMAKNGKQESSKVLNYKDYQELERKVLTGSL